MTIITWKMAASPASNISNNQLMPQCAVLFFSSNGHIYQSMTRDRSSCNLHFLLTFTFNSHCTFAMILWAILNITLITLIDVRHKCRLHHRWAMQATIFTVLHFGNQKNIHAAVLRIFCILLIDTYSKVHEIKGTGALIMIAIITLHWCHFDRPWLQIYI